MIVSDMYEDRDTKITLLLKKFREEMDTQSSLFLGHPGNLRYDYTPLFEFFNYSLNNIGDPFHESNSKINTRKFEREVLRFFADLYKLPDFWGYVTSGGTEGNMYGILMGRELYPDGILYFSDTAHYSIPKIAHMYRMKHKIVKSTAFENIEKLTQNEADSNYGEMNYVDFERLIRENSESPVILNMTIGTTMTGAIDNLDNILDILGDNNITQYYIHCDSALFGMMLPFMNDAPKIDFTKNIGSVSISGHKFIGSPIPCGIVLTRKEYMPKIEHNIEYIGSKDTTILGSRNGHAPLILWYALNTKGLNDYKEEVQTCLENAKHLHNRLNELSYPSLLNKHSNIVVLKRPPEGVIHKWQLGTEGNISHAIVMNHVTEDVIEAFVSDLEDSLKP